MGTDTRQRCIDDRTRSQVVRRTVVVAVALLVATSISAGYAAADTVDATGQQRATNDSYAVEQGGDCFEITPITGQKSVKAFYDYQTPLQNNTYTNTNGTSFSSEGTTGLQRNNASALFLYEDPTGNLSLVFVHGSVGNSSDGGSASLDISGLPDGGTWAVKDDQYAGESNYDNWTHDNGTTQVDWTWAGGKTDGGAYAGLGTEFRITIEPAFNAAAALDGEYYNGTVRRWSALSNGQSQRDSTALSTRPVTISSGGCDDGAERTTGDGQRDVHSR